MRPTQPHYRRYILLAFGLLANLACLTVIAGCHRSYYRRQADAEVQRLIAEKAIDPRWSTIDGDISVDVRSRMHDPFSQDHPPIPPDDPTSQQLMRQVDGKPAYPHWDANGDTDLLENPLWKSYLPINENGQVVLTLERSYLLAALHSPDLQAQQEALYQSALDVSLERFGFDTQLFAGFNSFLSTQGRLAPGGSQSTFSTALGANSEGINLSRLGITGASFAASLANSILFNLAGDNTQTATTLLDFSIIQPLLQNAGREFILEALTQSERTLLANIRQLERFKRGFYLQIAIGRSPGLGVSPTGSFLGPPVPGNLFPGGFLGLLEQQQQIRNQEFNVRQLEAVLSQFTEFYNSGLLDAVQFKLFESNFYQQQRFLLDARLAYQTALDNFKTVLGLPPDLDVIIDDEFLNQFELVSDTINDRLNDAGNVRRKAGQVLSEIDEAIQGFGRQAYRWPTNLEQQVESLRPSLQEAIGIIEAVISEDCTQLERDISRLENNRKGRVGYLRSLAADIAAEKIESNISTDLFAAETIPNPGRLRSFITATDQNTDADSPEQSASIMDRLQQLDRDLKTALQRIDEFPAAKQTASDQELYDLLNEKFEKMIPGQLAELNNIVLDLSLIQALARSNSIEIANSNIDSEQAIRVARCLRRDWMNARASLVDEYRNIEFIADQLEAGVNLVFNGSVGNFGDNPFQIRGETGTLSAGVQFDSPIVRLGERNAYRNALIGYQQAKRSLYQFEDAVKGDIRELVRNLGRNRVRFELDRRSVQVQIENVEINRLELDRPSGGNAGLGTTTARNLVEAINQLNVAQNDFLNTWVQYEVLRRNLDFDMGTMQLDSLGQWQDPGVIDESIGLRALAAFGIEPDCQFCENIGQSYSPVPPLVDVDQPTDDDDASDPPPPPTVIPETVEPKLTDPVNRPPRPDRLDTPAPTIERLDLNAPGGSEGLKSPDTRSPDSSWLQTPTRSSRRVRTSKLFKPSVSSSDDSWK